MSWKACVLLATALFPFSSFCAEEILTGPNPTAEYKDAIAFSFISRSEAENALYKANQKEKEKPQSQGESAVSLNSRLQIGGNYTYVRFNPHGHRAFHGNLGGMQALYEYNPLNGFYGGVKFAWRDGDTHGPEGKRSLLYFDAHERLGYTFIHRANDWLLTLFSGFGYRHIGQKLRPKEGNSLHFRYNEFYFPVGLIANFGVSSRFSFGTNFTWMPQVYPTVSIIPLKGARWKITSTLPNFLVEVPMTFTLTKNRRFLLILTPSYEHWQDGHTTAKLPSGASLGIPGNTYNFFGANLDLGYRF